MKEFIAILLLSGLTYSGIKRARKLNGAIDTINNCDNCAFDLAALFSNADITLNADVGEITGNVFGFWETVVCSFNKTKMCLPLEQQILSNEVALASLETKRQVALYISAGAALTLISIALIFIFKK